MFYRMPMSVRYMVRRAVYFPSDIIAKASGKQSEFIPPRGAYSTFGDGDFLKIGNDYREMCITMGGLKPDMRVFEIGSGYGRIAVGLAGYLSTGSYEGMDINAKAVAWCKEKIEPRHPHFRFQHTDIYNKQYNPSGKWQAAEYKFPYEKETFDFIFLGSVFTHMFPPDVDNYLGEIGRLLKPKGRSFITYFLLNEEASKRMERKEARQSFSYRCEDYYTIDRETPERGIAYDEKYIRNLYAKNGLSVIEPIYFGTWSGPRKTSNYQDIIVATRQGGN